jgi:hypothetical protein
MSDPPPSGHGSSDPLAARTVGPGGPDEFDYRPLRIDATVSRAAAATMLAVRAEFAGWELARVLGFPDGSRRVWLRRRRSPGLLPDLTP